MWEWLRRLICKPCPDVSQYTDRIAALEEEWLKWYNKMLAAQKQLLSVELERLALADEVELLAKQLADVVKIQVPNVENYVASPIVFDPWSYDFDVSGGVSIADEEYYTWTLSQWKSILSRVHPIVKSYLDKWVTEISDCDNWATVMAGMVSVAFKQAGLSKQGAFMVTWSRSHAFNAFMTRDGLFYIYEPQNDTIVGLRADMVDPYILRKVWFLS